MTNSKAGGKSAIQTQIKKYGSKKAFSEEMSRRAKLRKTIGKGGFYDVDVAKKAAAKSAETRAKNAKRKKSIEKLQSEASHIIEGDEEAS